jgi:hypothetical protein
MPVTKDWVFSYPDELAVGSDLNLTRSALARLEEAGGIGYRGITFG